MSLTVRKLHTWQLWIHEIQKKKKKCYFVCVFWANGEEALSHPLLCRGSSGHRLLSQKLQGQLRIAVNLPRMPGSATSDWASVSPSVKWRYLVTWHRLSSTNNQLPFNCNNGKSRSFVSWNSNLKRNQELVLHCDPQVSYKGWGALVWTVLFFWMILCVYPSDGRATVFTCSAFLSLL